VLPDVCVRWMLNSAVLVACADRAAQSDDGMSSTFVSNRDGTWCVFQIHTKSHHSLVGSTWCHTKSMARSFSSRFFETLQIPLARSPQIPIKWHHSPVGAQLGCQTKSMHALKANRCTCRCKCRCNRLKQIGLRQRLLILLTTLLTPSKPSALHLSAKIANKDTVAPSSQHPHSGDFGSPPLCGRTGKMWN